MAARHRLDAEYLVVGSGAMGMAFVDVVLTEDPAARIVMVDRHARPGGHWNDSYGFVFLHQPAAYYGVCSEPLGAGGAELASGQEVLAYYDRVIAKLVGTGRLQYFPMCEYQGEGRFVSTLEPNRSFQVELSRKHVDATYMNVEVPSAHPPRYEVAPELTLVPPNGLPAVREPHTGYVVIGAGKTGIDAVLFLLQQGVAADHITWIMSRDAWLLDRAQIQPGRALDQGLGMQLENIAASKSVDDVFRSLERDRRILRLDPEVSPSKYRCATVSQEELQVLRQVRNVVRKGRVLRIEPTEIVLEQGSIPTDAGVLHVDCTANGLAQREIIPVFEGDRITLQSLFMCQQVFSAAVIAHVECAGGSDADKNELCQVVPHPEVPRDFLAAMLVSLRNQLAWTRRFGRWLRSCRLSMAHHESIFAVVRAAWKMRKTVPAAMERMQEILEREPAG